MSEPLSILLNVAGEAYRTESELTERLTSRAEKYLAAVGVILSLAVVGFERFTFHGILTEIIATCLACAGIVLALIATLLTLHSMQLRDYATYPETQFLLRLAEDTKGKDIELPVVKMYLTMRDDVLCTNERRAKQLIVSGILVLLSFSASIAGYLTWKAF